MVPRATDGRGVRAADSASSSCGSEIQALARRGDGLTWNVLAAAVARAFTETEGCVSIPSSKQLDSSCGRCDMNSHVGHQENTSRDPFNKVKEVEETSDLC